MSIPELGLIGVAVALVGATFSTLVYWWQDYRRRR